MFWQNFVFILCYFVLDTAESVHESVQSLNVYSCQRV